MSNIFQTFQTFWQTCHLLIFCNFYYLIEECWIITSSLVLMKQPFDRYEIWKFCKFMFYNHYCLDQTFLKNTKEFGWVVNQQNSGKQQLDVFAKRCIWWFGETEALDSWKQSFDLWLSFGLAYPMAETSSKKCIPCSMQLALPS